MTFLTPAWDLALLVFVNQEWRTGFFDVIAPVLSATWLIWVLGGLGLVLGVRAVGFRRMLPALCVILAVGAADGMTAVLKKETCRQRPLNSVAGTWLHESDGWSQRPADYEPKGGCGSSFASAHAANTMAVALSIVLLWPRKATFCLLLLPLLTGWSRVYLGKHYPTDVLAGWIIGLVAALAVWGLWRLSEGYWRRFIPPGGRA